MNNPIKILIAEHDYNDIELIHYELKKGDINYISEMVEDEQTYSEKIKDFEPDIILSDYTFPAFEGLSAFALKENIAPHIPFIFVSGAIGEEKSIELIKSGVTDYVLKENLKPLVPKITRALEECKARKLRKEADRNLILSESRLARAQQIAQMGSWELDFSTNNILLSDEACRIHDVPLEQNIQSFSNWLGFIHPEDVAAVSTAIEDSRKSLVGFNIKYRILNKKGALSHIYAEGKPEYNNAGVLTGLYGIAQNITKTVLLENKLALEIRTRQSEITAAVLTAHETERAHIGQELHENLNQVLGAVKLYLETAKADDARRPMLLDKSVDYIVNVIGEIRKLSKQLASPGQQFGLLKSIKILIDDVTDIYPAKIHFYTRNIEENELNDKLQLTIFRIIQEQVNNIIKHSNATNATICIHKRNNNVVLIISDNGDGTNLLQEVNGVGIKNISSRADLFNGAVAITSRPGMGYQLKVVMGINSYRLQPVCNEQIA